MDKEDVVHIYIHIQWNTQFSSAQFSLSVMSGSLWPHGLQHIRLPCPSPTPSLLKLMSIKLMMPSNYLILCRSLLLLPSIFPRIRVFSNESALHIRYPKYWSSNFSISPSNEYSGLISFRMDWLDLLAVQGTLKSLLQHHSSKASILWHSAFFIVQLSHPYMTTGKTIASLPLFPFFLHLFAMKWWDQMPWSLLSKCWALSQLFHSPPSPSSRGSLVLHFLP